MTDDDRPYLHPAPETMGEGSSSPYEALTCLCGHSIERHDANLACDACECVEFAEDTTESLFDD